MADLSDIDLVNLSRIVGEVVGERVRQVTVHDRTKAVDDSRTMTEWSWILLRRVTDLAHPFASAHADERRELLEIAAVAVAALEALDRRAAAPVDEIIASTSAGAGRIVPIRSDPFQPYRPPS